MLRNSFDYVFERNLNWTTPKAHLGISILRETVESSRRLLRNFPWNYNRKIVLPVFSLSFSLSFLLLFGAFDF